MRLCSFCGLARAETAAGRLSLCADCRRALCAVEPGEARYVWFQNAVRGALFDGVSPCRPARRLSACSPDRLLPPVRPE